MQRINRVLVNAAIAFVAAYRYVLSPVLPRACRFEPSCSQYAIDALRQRGILHGVWLSLRRIARCNPFSQAGYDPVSNHERNSH